MEKYCSLDSKHLMARQSEIIARLNNKSVNKSIVLKRQNSFDETSDEPDEDEIKLKEHQEELIETYMKKYTILSK